MNWRDRRNKILESMGINVKVWDMEFSLWTKYFPLLSWGLSPGATSKARPASQGRRRICHFSCSCCHPVSIPTILSLICWLTSQANLPSESSPEMDSLRSSSEAGGLALGWVGSCYGEPGSLRAMRWLLQPRAWPEFAALPRVADVSFNLQ